MLNKKDLVTRVRDQIGLRYKTTEIEEIVNILFTEIANAIANGEDISIANFGKFFAKYVKGKKIKKTGIQWLQDKEFIIPDRFHFGFKPAASLNKVINTLLQTKLVITKK